MESRTLELPANPADAVNLITETSSTVPVMAFKKSPICPVSHAAEREFDDWLAGVPESTALKVAVIDVIAEKPLARGITSELGIRHESPQALYFIDGSLSWHGSHGELTTARFQEIATGCS